MLNLGRRRAAALAVLASMALLVGAAAPVAATDFHDELPAGLACSFGLAIDGSGGGPQNYHEFTDPNDNVTGFVLAGRGNDLLFTNMDTGATFSTRANGSVVKAALGPDSSLWTFMGHQVVILFPTDVPAGPSTTLFVGQVVIEIDAAGNYFVQKVAGTQLDICAALTD